ncbi:MAG: hypothetical protein JWO57_3432 [Pseudonocardiales bacterium]|nr:hypothetical protein [Pseudonocardiales bacterium]
MISDAGRAALDRFLATDPADVGCDRTLELLHACAELLVAGENPEQRYPGIAAHLRACVPCSEDLEGLLVAMGSELGER